MRSADFDLVVSGGQIVSPQGVKRADVGVKNGRISAIGQLGRARTEKRFNAAGLHVLPGVIDSQVHFREPGNNPAENLASGSRAALLGGVASVFEMPNTSPPTTSAAALDDKLARAEGKMFCHYAFYAGGVAENASLLPALEQHAGCCGVKVFMGSSTGTLLAATDADIAAILQNLRRRAAFHCEDEMILRARLGQRVKGQPASHPRWRNTRSALNATRRLVALAERYRRRVHVLHVTTKGEIEFLAQHKRTASVEVTPQHLTLAAPECYRRLGAYAQMNPPIRGSHHRRALWQGIRERVVDVIGSDHAPHTREAKEKTYPATPAGMPGVQTLVPVMLTHINRGRLSLPDFVRLVCVNPARLMGVRDKGRIAENYDADLTLVDMQARRQIENRWIASGCGWTPFDGFIAQGWPKAVVLRGRLAMQEDSLITPPAGEMLRFS